MTIKEIAESTGIPIRKVYEVAKILGFFPTNFKTPDTKKILKGLSHLQRAEKAAESNEFLKEEEVEGT